jgi:hypothetical protein
MIDYLYNKKDKAKMEIVQINETFNLLAILTGLVPVGIAIFFRKKDNWLTYLIWLFIIVTLLDITTFIVYKFLKQNIQWISPFYMFVIVVLLPIYFYHAIKETYLKKILILFQVIALLALTSKFVFSPNFSKYDQWSWLGIQIYIEILCIFNLFFVFRNLRSVTNNPHLYVSIGLFFMFFTPMFSSFFQDELYKTSPYYYQISLIILNFSSIISYLIVAVGIYKIKALIH